MAHFILKSKSIKQFLKRSKVLTVQLLEAPQRDRRAGLNLPYGEVLLKTELLPKVLRLALGFVLIFLSGHPSYAGYSRIVSLAPSITSSIYDLQSEDKVVGVTRYCDVSGKEIIGTLLEPNIEKIVSLRPDLILATKQGNSPRTVDTLRSLGLHVVVFEEANDFGGICGNFLALAKLLEKAAEAEEIVVQVKDKINLIYSKLKDLPQRKVFWQIGARPLATIGNGTFVAELIKYSGGENLFSDLEMPYPRISYEEVIRRNPEIIILVSMGDFTEKEKAYWLGFKDITAVKENKIFIVKSEKVCLPTPLRFLEGMKEITKLIHLEISNE